MAKKQTVDVYTFFKLKSAEAGISMNDMCEKAGVSPTLMTKWKHNEPKTIQIIRKLNSVFEESNPNNLKELF